MIASMLLLPLQCTIIHFSRILKRLLEVCLSGKGILISKKLLSAELRALLEVYKSASRHTLLPGSGPVLERAKKKLFKGTHSGRACLKNFLQGLKLVEVESCDMSECNSSNEIYLILRVRYVYRRSPKQFNPYRTDVSLKLIERNFTCFIS